MFGISLFRKKKRLLGVDIGTFSTKVVELSYSKKGKVFLENYGEKINETQKETLYTSSRKKAFLLPHQEIANNIRNVLNEAKIEKKEAVFSIPDFMTFFTVFKTPPMPKEEIASVVQFEARQHIPLPLQEVTLDWSVIEEANLDKKIGAKVLLVAVPNNVISEYQKVAQLSGLKLSSIEAEVFSLARASVFGEDCNKVIQLIDIGVQSTTISLVKENVIKATYSIDFSESEIAKKLVDKLGISYNEADEMRRKIGFVEDSNEGKVLCAQLDSLVEEIEQISENFFKTEKKEIDKIILAGGLSLSNGMKTRLEEKTKRKIEIVNPFVDFSYNPILKNSLREMGPRYAIAVGLALRDKE